LAAAVVTAMLVALLFVVRTTTCYAASDGPDQAPHCTTAPVLGTGLTWVLALVGIVLVVYCVVQLVASRR
jgi:hypothetical protein